MSLLLNLVILMVLPTLSLKYGPVRFFTVDLVVGLLAFATLVLLVAHPSLLAEHRVTSIDLFGLLLLASVTVSLLLSQDHYHSIERFGELLRFAVVYQISRFAFAAGVSRTSVYRTVAVIGIALISLGCVQAATHSQIGLVGNLFGSDRSQMESFKDSKAAVHFRISGPTPSPIVYGLWVVLFAGLPLTSLLMKGRYVSGFLLAGAMGFVVMESHSRGALLTLGVYLVLIVGMGILGQSSQPRRLLILTVVMALGLVTVLSSLGWREALSPLLVRDTQVSAQGRLAMLRESGKLLQEPKIFLFGTGPGRFYQEAAARGDHPGPNVWRDYTSSSSGVHNVFLKIWVEHGIIALLATLAAVGFVLRLSIEMMRSGEKVRDRTLGLWLVTMNAAFILTACQVYETPLEHYFLVPFAVFVALLVEWASVRGPGNTVDTPCRESKGVT